MKTLKLAFSGGLRDARRVRLILPLYLLSLLFACAQTWPLFNNRALRNPFLSELAVGGADAFANAALSNPEGATVSGSLWLLASFVLTMFFGAAYNFWSGGVLSVWGGTRRFGAGGARFFISFSALGAMLVLLALIAAALALTLGAPLGGFALLLLFALAQVINLIGEYARAIGVARERRNPFVLLGMAAGFMVRRGSGALALGALGLCLHLLLLWLYGALDGWFANPLGSLLLQQSIVFAWLWVKSLRLAWAWNYVRAADLDPSGLQKPEGSALPLRLS